MTILKVMVIGEAEGVGIFSAVVPILGNHLLPNRNMAFVGESRSSDLDIY